MHRSRQLRWWSCGINGAIDAVLSTVSPRDPCASMLNRGSTGFLSSVPVSVDDDQQAVSAATVACSVVAATKRNTSCSTLIVGLSCLPPLLSPSPPCERTLLRLPGKLAGGGRGKKRRLNRRRFHGVRQCPGST
ncbi:hypothetical protein DPEC_G00065450 [Dallia pectoralis]|uniref:Uncharacterized protein n=1 Tax=Dallia pectoralis TaxID=75939 RepID=A0ACC2H8F9_DALPE|nr:hypothetical protein DPEC_G00065450 [Dallia pectoralis]